MSLFTKKFERVRMLESKLLDITASTDALILTIVDNYR